MLRPPQRQPSEQLAAFLDASPPRTVPPQIERIAVRQSVPSSIFVLGIVFILFGALFLVVMFPWRIDRDLRLRAGPAAVVEGTVTAITATNLRLNKTRVYRYEFEFRPSPSEQRLGWCFATGRIADPGQAVRVQYRTDDPSLACIEGARLTEGGFGATFTLLFPAIGCAVVWVAMAIRKHTRYVLRHGVLTEATIVDYVMTATRKNRTPVCRIDLRLEGFGKTINIQRTASEVIQLLEERKVGGVVRVLVDPEKVRRVVLVEALFKAA